MTGPIGKTVAEIRFSKFAKGLEAIKEEAKTSVGNSNAAENRMWCFHWVFFVISLISAATLSPLYLISFLLPGIWQSIHWGLFAHHELHDAHGRRHTFAQGSVLRRVIDWADVIEPRSWIYEHNHLHHSFTNTKKDPDFLIFHVPWSYRNIQGLTLAMITWRWSYYSTNAYELLRHRKKSSNGFYNLWDVGTTFFLRVWGPYIAFRFVFLPFIVNFVMSYLMSALGVQHGEFFWNTFINLLLAEIVTNIYTFVIIVPNHIGSDLYWFDEKKLGHSRASCKLSDEPLIGQVLASCNYSTGSDWIDYFHAGLNYQIEHHMFPTFGIDKLRHIQPRMRELCEQCNIPYVQESVFKRFWKMARVFVGLDEMRAHPVLHA